MEKMMKLYQRYIVHVQRLDALFRAQLGIIVGTVTLFVVLRSSFARQICGNASILKDISIGWRDSKVFLKQNLNVQ